MDIAESFLPVLFYWLFFKVECPLPSLSGDLSQQFIPPPLGGGRKLFRGKLIRGVSYPCPRLMKIPHPGQPAALSTGGSWTTRFYGNEGRGGGALTPSLDPSVRGDWGCPLSQHLLRLVAKAGAACPGPGAREGHHDHPRRRCPEATGQHPCQPRRRRGKIRYTPPPLQGPGSCAGFSLTSAPPPGGWVPPTRLGWGVLAAPCPGS